MDNKPEIYTVATAHLDTSWLWTLERTIEEYIPDTLKKNYKLLEKYPEYKFNFEGSYRYELIKEYYPEEYEKLKKYINEGRWNPCGACFENGDVNIPSPEALIRNILYGNGFFKKEFGVESNDIFLPDCFGFGKALPTVAAHSGLTGFSTGKLFWGSSVGVPFDIGKWTGADGNGIWAALMPFSYTTAFGKMSKAKRILNKLEDSKKNNLPEYTFVYHGIGDRGGSPHKSSVKNAVEAQRKNSVSDVEVYSATTKEFFDMLSQKNPSLPVYDGEFLLTAHGTGSYTSRTVTKRWNRRCELLADSAERFACAAYISGLSEYPQYGLDSAWKKVIAHHFHDDITGTSFEECYKRSHNDYVQAMNTFSAEYTSACKALSEKLDTSFANGIPVVVSNPVQTVSSRKEAVKVTVESKYASFAVFDRNGSRVPSQTKSISEIKKEITFIADVPSCGLAVYDLRSNQPQISVDTGLKATANHIENKNLSVDIDENGDICSIFDKQLGKELLNKPVRFSLLSNISSFDWPAWEIKYEDLCRKPYMYAQNPVIEIKDSGDALCSLEITKAAGKSVFRQIVSLDCESKFISVYNETDWREEASLLKAEFGFTAKNEIANYDIGIGYTERKTNTDKLYEVPAQKWADITDESGDFGVSVFSDSRVGWDKPDNSTLRLTLIHTPLASYRWECSQHIMDMGLNRYSFAIMGHKGNPSDSTGYSDLFCQPMHTFITDKHDGGSEKEFSFVKLSNDRVRITAVKKAQDSDEIILRVSECSGNDHEGIEADFSFPIKEAYSVRGDETRLRKAETKNGRLYFDIKRNEIKSFSIRFEKSEKTVDSSTAVALGFNATGITSDADRHKSTLTDGISVPREILPEKIFFSGLEYSFSAEEKNCLVCDGSKINIGGGYSSVHLLLTSLNGDKTVKFRCGDKITEAYIPDCSEPLGHWDLIRSGETGYIKPVPQALTLTHTHSKNDNMIAKQFFIFSCAISLDAETEITLPDDKDVVIFAATASKADRAFIKGDSHCDNLEKRKFDYEFSDYAIKNMNPAKAERLLDRFIDRSYSAAFKIGEFHNKYAFDELYYIIRKLLGGKAYKKQAVKLTESRNKSQKEI